MGLAFGILVGLVPKGNLLAVFLAAILAASRVNLGVAAGAIVCCSLASPLIDPISHVIGSWLLKHPGLSSFWTWLYNLPVAPWTGFNNSVVLGSFVVGLILLYPAHRLSRPVFEKYSEGAGKWIRRFWLTRALMGAEWAARVGVVE
ncbi:MAG: TIGR03546 family protein [Fuerstiella sp.]|nr:TIGR03546 family protein [Fuerstiella sp.]